MKMLPEVHVDTTSLPRLRPLHYDEVDDETRQVFDEFSHASPRNPFLGTLMYNPELARLHSPFIHYLRHSTCLTPRDREIIVLRTAWTCGADMQWANHSRIALGCGLEIEEIAAIPEGAESAVWSEEEKNVLRAVDELHASCRIGDETWSHLSSRYDERQLVEFLFLVGAFRTLAYVMSGIGIRPDVAITDRPGNRFLFSGS
jgi:4-carboxymuconolactone decarboxylase